MHPSMEAGADGYEGYGPRGTTPSYAGGGYAGTPFNPSSDHSRHVSQSVSQQLACCLAASCDHLNLHARHGHSSCYSGYTG